MVIRGNMEKWFIIIVLVFVMVAGGEVWGIRPASAAAEPIKLRMMMPTEPGGGDIFGGMQGTSTMAEPVVYNVMEPLVDVGKKGEFVPKLATKWEHSPDFIKWRFYLRKGVKFHNGADFTARDVVEFAKWNIEEKNLSQIYQRMPIHEAVAVDAYTVDLIFDMPQPLLLTTGYIFLIPPAAISKDNRKMLGTNPMGTGPYKFVEWERGRYIKMTKFEGYWGPKPQIDDVDILFRGEEAIRVAALRVGEVDWIYSPSIESAKSLSKAKVARQVSPNTLFIRFDEYIQKETTGKDPIFTDKRLRLAVEYAIDRKALINLYGGFATLSPGQFASLGDFGFNPDLKSRPYDLEKAKALVREAGAVDKTATLCSASDRSDRDREVAEAVAFMIEQTGLKVKLMLMPRGEYNKYWRVLGSDRPYKTDLFIRFSEAVLEVESRYAELLVKGGRHCAHNDPETTKLYKEVIAEGDYAKRGVKLGKAWAYAYEQAHYVPLLKPEMLWGLAPNLEWTIDIAGRPFFSDMRFTR